MKNTKEYAGYARTKNTLKLLKLILEHGLIQGKDVANQIGVTERQVLKYVKDLRQCGINVKSKVGVHGGYYIDDWKCPICNSRLYTKDKDRLK